MVVRVHKLRLGNPDAALPARENNFPTQDNARQNPRLCPHIELRGSPPNLSSNYRQCCLCLAVSLNPEGQDCDLLGLGKQRGIWPGNTDKKMVHFHRGLSHLGGHTELPYLKCWHEWSPDQRDKHQWQFPVMRKPRHCNGGRSLNRLLFFMFCFYLILSLLTS